MRVRWVESSGVEDERGCGQMSSQIWVVAVIKCSGFGWPGRLRLHNEVDVVFVKLIPLCRYSARIRVLFALCVDR